MVVGELEDATSSEFRPVLVAGVVREEGERSEDRYASHSREGRGRRLSECLGGSEIDLSRLGGRRRLERDALKEEVAGPALR